MHATLSCPVLSYLVLSCLLERRPFHEVIPHCLVLPRLVLSWPLYVVIPHCPVLSHLVLSWPFYVVRVYVNHIVLSCPVLSCILEWRPFHEIMPHCLVRRCPVPSCLVFLSGDRSRGNATFSCHVPSCFVFLNGDLFTRYCHIFLSCPTLFYNLQRRSFYKVMPHCPVMSHHVRVRFCVCVSVFLFVCLPLLLYCIVLYCIVLYW